MVSSIECYKYPMRNRDGHIFVLREIVKFLIAHTHNASSHYVKSCSSSLPKYLKKNYGAAQNPLAA